VQPLTTRPWITSGIAVVGAGLIAVAPVAPHTPDLHMPDVQLTAFDPFGAWIDVFNTSSANAEAVADTFFVAPGAVLQQLLVNQVGYLGDIISNPGNIGDVFSTIGDHLQTLFTNTTLLNWDPDIADLEATRPIAQAGDIMHGLANLMLPLVMGGDMDPDTLAIVTEVMHFIASPVTGLLMGALGPVLSPLVEFGNSVGDIFASLGGEDPLSVLQELYDLPARVLGSIFNGSELSLDFLIPLIADAGVLPEGLEIESLSLGLGGLLSPGLSGLPVGGDIDQMAEDLINTGIGGSLWNSVGLVIPGVFELDANGVGPLGSLVAFSQIVAGAIGWEGGGNPLADLSYPIMPILDWFGGEG